MTTEIEKLKQMALDRYSQDYGVMCECWSDDDYVEAIARDGTAEKAWAFHVEIVEAKRETQACYDMGEY